MSLRWINRDGKKILQESTNHFIGRLVWNDVPEEENITLPTLEETIFLFLQNEYRNNNSIEAIAFSSDIFLKLKREIEIRTGRLQNKDEVIIFHSPHGSIKIFEFKEFK